MLLRGVKIAVELPAEFESAGEWLADVHALEAAGADAFALGEGPHDRGALLAALAAVTYRAELLLEERDQRLTTVRALTRGRVADATEAWHRVPVPDDRAHWARLQDEAQAEGAAGLLVPMNPRLLDLLRNPEQSERDDLNLATG
jgi:hypothetical protein